VLRQMDRRGRQSHKGSVSSVSSASGWLSWCKKNVFGMKEGNNGSSFEETEPLRTLVLMEESEEFDVEECPICNTVSMAKLCSAIPCKHEACERCWLAWQRQHNVKTCMICALPIKHITVPSGGSNHAKSKGSDFVKAADEALEDALRPILRIKNELLDIVEKVEETQNHLAFLLQNAQAGVFDSDSATSIVQVEVATTHEQLEKLVETTAVLSEVDKALQLLNKCMRDLESLAKKSFADMNEWSRETIREFVHVITPTTRDNRTALALQWQCVVNLLDQLMHSKLNVVQAMAMVMPMEGFSLLSSLERAKVAVSSGMPLITDMVRIFESEAHLLIKNVNEWPQHADPQDFVKGAAVVEKKEPEMEETVNVPANEDEQVEAVTENVNEPSAGHVQATETESLDPPPHEEEKEDVPGTSEE